jgi:hypothetical protein
MKVATILLVMMTLMQVRTVAESPPCDGMPDYPIRFAVLGDRTGSAQEGVYGAIVEQIARLHPEFVITVGDMIEGYTSDPDLIRERWDEYFTLLQPLTVPIYYTPGNNDITTDAMEPAYRERIGEPYRSFDYRGMHIIILDNSRWETFEEMPDEQIEWLRNDLAANQSACYTLVFMHKPFWYRTLGDGKPDEFHELFKANGVDAVFTGHFHRYFSGEFDGIKYTTVGSSGGGAPESPEGLLYHFGWVTIDTSGVHVVPIKKDAVLPWTVQTVDEARAESGVEAAGIRFVEPLPIDDKSEVDEGTVTVMLENEFAASAYGDTLRWEVPEGWAVDPVESPFTMAAHGSTSAQFLVRSAGKLYPLPEISARIPYGEGKTTLVNRPLEIARMATCVPAGEVTIDGQLTERCWSVPALALFENDGSVTKQDSTVFYFAYDDDNLYMGVYCRESKMDSLKATLTERDAGVFAEDAVGLMFCADAKGDDAYQVYINPVGTIYDQHLERLSDGFWEAFSDWNGEYDVETVRDGDFYTVEIRIPLAQHELSARSGDRWRVNFRRKQYRLGSAAGFQAPWSYDPRTYGELVFR